MATIQSFGMVETREMAMNLGVAQVQSKLLCNGTVPPLPVVKISKGANQATNTKRSNNNNFLGRCGTTPWRLHEEASLLKESATTLIH